MLRYIKGTIDYTITYDATSHQNLRCYSDADFAGDTQSRRSTSGVSIFLGEGAVSFRSSTQQLVATSTTEAEYIAAALASRELVWMNRLIVELGLNKSESILFIDNQSTIKLIKNGEFHNRTKHIDIRAHYVRTSYKRKEFDIKYIPTEDQKSDILTKASGPTVHKRMISNFGLAIALIALVAIGQSDARFSIEDLVVLRKTPIKHVYGQTDITLTLGFHDPCHQFFKNLTKVPRTDIKLRSVHHKI